MAHKHSMVVKSEVEFFVKKAGKSFGVEIKDTKGNLITKLYGSLNRTIRNSTQTIGDLIEGEKINFDAPEKKGTKKGAVVTKKAGKGINKDVEGLAKNIAKAFAEFVS